MDVNLLVSAMVAGASAYGPNAVKKLGEIVGTEVVKEATKEAYKTLKGTLASVRGRSAKRAAEKVEEDPTSEAARDELALTLADLPKEDIPEVEEKLDLLLKAFKNDDVALRVAETVASVKLDIDSGGHVRLINIKGARTLDVKSKSVGDFDLHDIDMDGDRSRGN